MINKIVSKLSKPFKELEKNESSTNTHRAAAIVEEMTSDMSQYEMIDIEAIAQEIKDILKIKKAYEEIDLNILIDETHAKIEVSSSILQVILDILNTSVAAFSNDSTRKEIKLQFISNEYGLEIECCDNSSLKGSERDISLDVSREIIQEIFSGKINPSSRDFSRSTIHPVDNSEKTCFYIAIPYSSSCIIKEGY